MTICDVNDSEIVASLRQPTADDAPTSASSFLSTLPSSPGPGELGAMSGTLTINLQHFAETDVLPALRDAVDQAKAHSIPAVDVLVSSELEPLLRRILLDGQLQTVDAKRCRQTEQGFKLILTVEHSGGDSWRS